MEEMMLQAVKDARKLLSLAAVAGRWDVSIFTVRRLADQGLITTINIGARRMISIEECERIETQGVGKARPRKAR
jgi:hypothetical protein